MIRRIVGVAALSVVTGFCMAGATGSAQAQSIIFGPNGVHVESGPPPRHDGDFHRHDHNFDHHDFDHDDRWRAVRERMHEYRDECRDGDRGACVRLGIIIGQNQERRADWQREHPAYFWWDRD